MAWTTPKDWSAGGSLLESDFDAQFRDNLAFLKANTAWATAVELTIATGVITKTQSHHTIDTEADAATDDLDTINGCSEGELFLIRPVHTDRTIVLKHNTGNIILPGGTDFTMDSTEKAALCFYNGSKVLVLGIIGLPPHKTTHENGGSDEISVTGLSGLLADGQTPLAHKTSHENGGGDEISVLGLSGLLADAQTPLAHATSHKTGGSDILYVPRTYSWFISGTVATGTEQRQTYRMKRATIVEDVELHAKTGPVGSALIIDINEAGVTLFSTNPEIDDGGTTEDNNHVFADTALAAGAELTMDVDQVGSGTAGADLTVLLHCKEAVI